MLTEQEMDTLADKIAERIVHRQPDQWCGVSELAHSLPVVKGRDFILNVLLPQPQFKGMYNTLHPGMGRPIRINKTKVLQWINDHPGAIDWSEK